MSTDIEWIFNEKINEIFFVVYSVIHIWNITSKHIFQQRHCFFVYFSFFHWTNQFKFMWRHNVYFTVNILFQVYNSGESLSFYLIAGSKFAHQRFPPPLVVYRLTFKNDQLQRLMRSTQTLYFQRKTCRWYHFSVMKSFYTFFFFIKYSHELSMKSMSSFLNKYPSSK